MPANIVTAVIDRDKVFQIIGLYDWARDLSIQEGILVPPRGSSFPSSTVASELFYRDDQDVLYMRNAANSAWVAIGGTGVGTGDVVGPGSSTDNVIVRFDGATGKLIQDSNITLDDNGRINNTYFHPAGATNPVSPTPQAGDRYYNTALNLDMVYDGTRSKWLSVTQISFQAGRNGSTPSGGYYRGINGLTLSATVGYAAPYNGTVVAGGYTRTDTDSANFQLVANGSTLVSGNSTATSATANNLNADFNLGDALAARNGGPNTTSNVQIWWIVKWRV